MKHLSGTSFSLYRAGRNRKSNYGDTTERQCLNVETIPSSERQTIRVCYAVIYGVIRVCYNEVELGRPCEL